MKLRPLIIVAVVGGCQACGGSAASTSDAGTRDASGAPDAGADASGISGLFCAAPGCDGGVYEIPLDAYTGNPPCQVTKPGDPSSCMCGPRPAQNGCTCKLSDGMPYLDCSP